MLHRVFPKLVIKDIKTPLVLLNKIILLANIYLFKVSNKNTSKRCEICSKLTIKTPGVFIINLEHFLQVFIVVFEQVNLSWLIFLNQIRKTRMFRVFVVLELEMYTQYVVMS